MHDMGVSLDDELVGHLDAADSGHAAAVVAAEIEQLQMLCALLFVRQQVALQFQVLRHVGAALAGTGDRPHGDGLVLEAHQNFGRRPNHVEVLEIEEEHVR